MFDVLCCVVLCVVCGEGRFGGAVRSAVVCSVFDVCVVCCVMCVVLCIVCGEGRFGRGCKERCVCCVFDVLCLCCVCV